MSLITEPRDLPLGSTCRQAQTNLGVEQWHKFQGTYKFGRKWGKTLILGAFLKQNVDVFQPQNHLCP